MHFIGRFHRGPPTLLRWGAALSLALGATWSAHAAPPAGPQDLEWRSEGLNFDVFGITTGSGWEQWVCGDGGRIAHRIDNGSWTFQTTPDAVRDILHRVFFLPPAGNDFEGWAVGEDGYVLHTTDGGTNWAVQTRLSYGGVFEELYDVHALPGGEPHDLAIDAQANMAVFRTQYFNVVLTDLAIPDPQDIVLDFRNFGIVNNAPGTQTFVSDSVLIAPPFVQDLPYPAQGSAVRHYALTLGAEGTIRANVDVIDLRLSPPARVHTFAVAEASLSQYIYPADFHLGPSSRQFILRCNALPNDSGLAGGRDFARFDLEALTEMARIGGRGRVWAVDSVEIGRSQAVSVGEDPALPAGYVHVVKVQ